MGALDRVFRSRRPSQNRPVATIIGGLWRNGEQGAWYDSSDLSTMFQDPAGTTPVYMPGQGQPDPWIGLQLDKRKGLFRGPELLTNGDFGAAGSGWFVTNEDATHTVTFSGGAARYQSDTTSPVLSLQQIGKMTTGAWYEITVVISAWVSGSIKSDGLSGAGAAPVFGTSAGVFKAIARASSPNFDLKRNTVNVDMTIDSVSVRELPGNHRWQGTATSRPVLSARYNWAVATEDLTPSAWAKGIPAFTVTPKATLAPDGVSMADVVVSPDTGTPVLSQQMAAAATSAAVTFFIKPIANAASLALLFRNHTTSTNYNPTLLNTVTGAVGDPAWAAQSVPGGWWKVTYTKVGGMSMGDSVVIYAGATGAPATPGRSWAVWGLDVRGANDGAGLPPYQKVVDGSNYDTAGFPLYRKPDGADDWMQTAAVDFSATDKVTIAAALRKLTEVAVGMFAELGPDVTVTAGTFGLYSRNSGVAEGIMWRSRGTSIASAAPPGLLAPVSMVALGASDLSAGRHEVRVNGVLAASSSTLQGGGAYGAYPIYFDRRAGASLPSSARDYGTLIVGRLLTGPETAAVEKFLRQKSRAY